MWLNLAELELILEALEARCEQPYPVGSERTHAERIKLRDYFRGEVVRVQEIKADWDAREAARFAAEAVAMEPDNA